MSTPPFAEHIEKFDQCLSWEERKQRLGVNLVNGLIWFFLAGMIIATLGIGLLVIGFGWFINWLFSEYNVRKLQALGVTVSESQLPTVYNAVQDICERFQVENRPKVIVLASGEVNAFALQYARKHVLVLLTELLESVIETPDQLRALLAHEMCHNALDHGSRSWFELVKPARYKQARELTCDNAGLIAAGNLDASKQLLRKLCLGRRMYKLLNEDALIDEARYIYSGFTGWLIKKHLTHPPMGTRMKNLDRWYREVTDDLED